MKKLSTLLLVLTIISVQSFGQKILYGPSEVCPEETVEYLIDSTRISGEQEFSVSNGKFIVADSLYKKAPWATGIDSTFISLDVDSVKKIEILWGSAPENGIVRWYPVNQSHESQEFEIGYAEPPSPYDVDSVVINGNTQFTFKVSENFDKFTYYRQNSSNITFKRREKVEEYPIVKEIVWKYIYEISEDQPGWVKLYTRSKNADCDEPSEDVIINIHRKLIKPTLTSGNNSICNSNQTYTISGESNSDTYTWTTTNGLKIYKNGQYLTTYTGTETSLTLSRQSNSGQAYLKIKAHAQDYYDSDELTIPIFMGDPDPSDFSISAVDNYGNSIDLGDETFEVCDNEYYTFYLNEVYELPSSHHKYNITSTDFYFDFNYTIVNEGFGWAYVYVNSIYDYSVVLVDVEACSTLNEFLVNEIEEGCSEGGYYYMSYSPNPADSYVSITIESEYQVKDKNNKIKIKKNKDAKAKDGDFGEYLIQILDNNRVVRKSLRTKSLSSNIDTRDLKPGTYFLHITYGDEIYKQQLIIN